MAPEGAEWLIGWAKMRAAMGGSEEEENEDDPPSRHKLLQNGDSDLVEEKTNKDVDRDDGLFNWNSPAMRALIPDFISIGAGFTGIAGVGAGTNLELNWVLRGPEASVLPILTASQNIGGGFSIDATLNLEGVNYLGTVNEINRRMIHTRSENGDFPTLWGSADFTAGGKLGVTGAYTPTTTGYGLIGRQLNIGVGLPVGPLPANGAAGVGNTFILRDYYNKGK